MKKLLLTCLLVGPLILSATPVCVNLGSGGNGSTDTGTIPYSTWAAIGFTCSIGDKIINNVNADGSPSDTSLRITTQVVGSDTNYIVTFNGNFNTSFQTAYTITIDPALAPAGAYISQVGLDLNAPAMGATATVVKTVAGWGDLTATPSSKPPALATHATSLSIVDSFTGTGAVSFSNSFTQTTQEEPPPPPSTVPEPASMVLIGTGLTFASMFARRRIA